MASIHPPSGFRDFINQEASRRMKLMTMISEVYQSFGFFPLETPVLESIDVLSGGVGGEENEKLIFKVMKRGEKLKDALATQNEDQIAEYGLRFDLTVPLSRAVASHRSEIHLPWKVFHIGPVWRAERPQKGRFREFIQCDVDIVGAKGIGAEIEVIQATVSAIQKVGASGFELRINDRRLIEAMAGKYGFLGEKLNQFAILLDKIDKLPFEEILNQLQALLGAPLPSHVSELVQGRVSLEEASQFHPEAGSGLKEIIETIRSLKLPLNQIVF